MVKIKQPIFELKNYSVGHPANTDEAQTSVNTDQHHIAASLTRYWPSPMAR